MWDAYIKVGISLLGIMGGVITIDRVIDIVLKFKGRAESPTVELSQRVATIEAELERIHGFLAKDKQRLDANDKGASVIQKAILALIDNAIDDRDKTPLLEAKKDLHDYLIERQLEN